MSNLNLKFLTTLESIIVDRRENPAAESYTSGLFALGPKRIAQKVGEEAVELALAAVDGDRTETVNEAADLMFHLLVLLNSRDICLTDVVAALESRHTADH
ncbi:MAG: phosphoribosyl-ATP diphosphatase [Gammaproteobacteria bacterium]|nr:phosphoribosyl-ATP diphosphatase [Gammaproteobacteria bacterium]MDH3805924.1 phosphoribosyl-ATP diphosphatase [Gammaproteobacteria bacterium]